MSALASLESLIAQARGGEGAGRKQGTPPTSRQEATYKEQQQEAAPSSASAASTSAAATSAAAAAPAAAACAPPRAEPAADAEFERKYALIRSVGEECVTEAELRNLLLKKPNFVLYDGFEPSGRMHIAQGVFKAMNVNKCTSAGGTFIFWVADWFALMNDKMGGSLERIKTVGEYLVRVWRAAGMDMTRVKFLWSSEEITKHAPAYWTQALDIARRFSVTRIKKCCQIMGRLEDTLTAAQILYPIMQCTDIFFLKADVCQLGVDQRKVNMLAREYCDLAHIKLKPVILSHHMLYGLAMGQAKMSKSDADSAIFMEDSAEDVERKIRKAYCPLQEGEVAEKPPEESMTLLEDKLKNPCLDYVQNIIFAAPGSKFVAAGTTYTSFEAVREAFLSEQLKEGALKDGLIAALNLLLEPVRTHFSTDAEAARVFALIKGWMAEPKQKRPTPLRRLAALDGAAAAWVVHAPLPTAQPTVGAALDTLRCLKAAPAGRQRVLWLGDWSAFCLNCLSGGKSRDDDLKAIAASFAIFVAGLRAIAPDAMADVHVVSQSKALLANPSDYWISVINAGRAFQLSRVLAALDEPNPDAVKGHVLASLMHVADVLAIAGASTATVCCTAEQRPLAELALEYMAGARLKDAGLALPEVHVVEAVSLRLRADEAQWDAEAELLLLDGQADVQRKLKRAFCEPNNVAFCPPLVVAEALVLQFAPSILLPTKQESGPEPRFSSSEELRGAYSRGEVHPGDLKPAVRDGANDILERVRVAVGADKGLKESEKELAKVLKRKKK
uniref:tyrosine--tRNA ligase n=1 Tax=Calcidiscus leptoporus TaxID=127549 RepID=A0A7S0P4F4_9EUKA|mmetsp:Transcript_5635/g.13052  ORF Transcript_5635/g.13052 Transcript_5635/m.13052 type:complete len:785 (+) Transcript_5635:36-2390(+)|eukprot:CAMPEP_0119378200 /NCGR_PEP_ID=MMETSP1334-20130426/47460_1 /TAXON_ID=127549 /ORGANISM="Calcidiscus leptoporus, Strain RCC1130" /LENGTH=784 /DNA_ID=CAMNT_0007397329 /DNA_START=36 /DNA_END=2390 /DNA_ORIENTATION=-